MQYREKQTTIATLRGEYHRHSCIACDVLCCVWEIRWCIQRIHVPFSFFASICDVAVRSNFHRPILAGVVVSKYCCWAFCITWYASPYQRNLGRIWLLLFFFLSCCHFFPLQSFCHRWVVFSHPFHSLRCRSVCVCVCVRCWCPHALLYLCALLCDSVLWFTV